MARFDILSVDTGELAQEEYERPGGAATFGSRQQVASRVVGSIDTGELAEMLESLRRDLDSRSTAPVAGGVALDAIEISMALTAEGKLAFLASAGFEASIKVTLKAYK